ncbi:uncharacterized protein ASCRUDRAFT_10747 [Ascoidea rubescens DSM 1968]|uniref:Uncharacterized protein n=1 Tax=Ascoidea rubescens DSM 1968 TaxID=1344418 RepID=A0A1D2V849_9ASCO|nr:hypothetical protein ASCRUDRAFT_10747 [Ascoidea rubescens DSM 1968]ODV57802.1 hypothetical protein ASCRUDRAFT_10747 [Ascoidea rubescens DSM 1968]
MNINAQILKSNIIQKKLYQWLTRILLFVFKMLTKIKNQFVQNNFSKLNSSEKEVLESQIFFYLVNINFSSVFLKLT